MIQTQKQYTNNSPGISPEQIVIDGLKKEITFKEGIIDKKTKLIKRLKKLIRSMEKGE